MLKKFAAAGIVTAATAGAMLLAGPANAAVNTNGTGNAPIVIPVNAPITVCGNSVPVASIGDALAQCKGDAGVGGGGGY